MLQFNKHFLHKISVYFLLFFLSQTAMSNPKKIDETRSFFSVHNVYVGFSVGGGSTTWNYLVDHIDHYQSGTTPTSAREFGPSWGVVLGYNIVKNFSIELQYVKFADSHLTFRTDGFFNFYNLSSPNVVSHTSAFSLSTKFYLPVYSGVSVFSAIGADVVIRRDVINDASCITPYMSGGVSYDATRHIILESGFQYFTGFGSSEVHPANHFVPFAWDAYFRMAYQI